MATRGQTVNDYLIGMILLLVSMIIVFGYFPGIFQPFEEEVSNEEEAIANNLATELVENSTVAGTKQTVSATALNRSIDGLVDNPERVGIPEWVRWNATVTDENGDVITKNSEQLQNGTAWRDQQSASTVRFVRIQDDGVCEDGCQLTVRVW